MVGFIRAHWAMILFVILIALWIFILDRLVASEKPFRGWVVSMVMLVILFGLIGKRVSKRWRGVLINDHNRISLSRVQMVMWTVIVVAFLFAAGWWNMTVQPDTGFQLKVPAEMYALMGIAATSLVGSPLILKIRAANAAAPRLQKQAQPSCADLFSDEETGGKVDLSRVQMFFFTLIVIIVYLVLAGRIFLKLTGDAVVEAFPELHEGAVALLAISHATYLTAKAT